MATIRCPSCNAELHQQPRFCPQCGARLSEPAANTPTIVLPSATPPPAPVPPTQPLPSLPSGYGTSQAGYPPPTAVEGGASRRLLLLGLIGGAGCLTLILLGTIALGALTLFGRQVADDPADSPLVSEQSGGAQSQSSPQGGAVLLEDDFDDPRASAFTEDEDAASRFSFERGGYTIEVKDAAMIVWARTDGSYKDLVLSVDAIVPAGADISAAGLIFHYQDNNNFYLFSVSNDGYYALELLQNNELVSLIDWTPSAAVDSSVNRIQVVTSADRIALYVNGELLEETADGTFTDGAVALAVSSLKDSTAEVRFDNLRIERNR